MLPLTIDIHPGVHPQWHLGAISLNRDTVINTLIAAAIVAVLGLWLRRQLVKRTEDHVPTKLQLLWEGVVDQVNTQVEDNLGHIHPYVAPLAIALFFFILFANWLEMIPSKVNSDQEFDFFTAPTADTNLTYALAILVIISVWVYGIRQRGVGGYFSHFIGQSIFPGKWYDVIIRVIFTFLNVLEEIIKPVTLALRLFGNIFAGGIMLGLIAGLVAWKIGPVPFGGVLAVLTNVLWKIFDMAIGVIQAFIFALLTVLYFAMAGAGHDEHEEHAEHA